MKYGNIEVPDAELPYLRQAFDAIQAGRITGAQADELKSAIQKRYSPSPPAAPAPTDIQTAPRHQPQIPLAPGHVPQPESVPATDPRVQEFGGISIYHPSQLKFMRDEFIRGFTRQTRTHTVDVPETALGRAAGAPLHAIGTLVNPALAIPLAASGGAAAPLVFAAEAGLTGADRPAYKRAIDAGIAAASVWLAGKGSGVLDELLLKAGLGGTVATGFARKAVSSTVPLGSISAALAPEGQRGEAFLAGGMTGFGLALYRSVNLTAKGRPTEAVETLKAIGMPEGAAADIVDVVYTETQKALPPAPSRGELARPVEGGQVPARVPVFPPPARATRPGEVPAPAQVAKVADVVPPETAAKLEAIKAPILPRGFAVEDMGNGDYTVRYKDKFIHTVAADSPQGAIEVTTHPANMTTEEYVGSSQFTKGKRGRLHVIEPGMVASVDFPWQKGGMLTIPQEEVLRRLHQSRWSGGLAAQEAPPAPATKEPWQMTLSEFESEHSPYEITRQQWKDMQRNERRRLGQSEESGTRLAPFSDYDNYHEQSVKTALQMGLPIPPAVLADYPDLAKPAPVAEQEPPAVIVTPAAAAKEAKAAAPTSVLRDRSQREKLLNSPKLVDRIKALGGLSASEFKRHQLAKLVGKEKLPGLMWRLGVTVHGGVGMDRLRENVAEQFPYMSDMERTDKIIEMLQQEIGSGKPALETALIEQKNPDYGGEADVRKLDAERKRAPEDIKALEEHRLSLIELAKATTDPAELDEIYDALHKTTANENDLRNWVGDKPLIIEGVGKGVTTGDLNLKPGDRLRIGDEKFKVTDALPGGKLVIKDGMTYVVDDTFDALPEGTRVTKRAKAAATTQPERPSSYFNGDRIEYTGKTDTRTGMYEYEFMEGHKKGKNGYTERPPNAPPGWKSKNTLRKIALEKEEQEGFRRLRESGESDQMPKQTRITTQAKKMKKDGSWSTMDNQKFIDTLKQLKQLAKNERGA